MRLEPSYPWSLEYLRHLIIGGVVLFGYIYSAPCNRAIHEKENLLTLGYPENLEVAYGKITYGAEAPRSIGSPTGLKFNISEISAGPDGYFVYGLRRSDEHRPQVWKAFTRDGIVFEDARMLFEVPPPDPSKRWLAGDVALTGNEILLLQCRLGNPPLKGHPFHAFAGKTDGSGWRQLDTTEYIYRGQDAFNIRWNEALGKFVNYQTSYQPFQKQYPDNIPKIRRVLHIRTSPDGINWTPGKSFGGDGPYLPDDQLIVPDKQDYPDAEFYHFSVIDLGEFWAGTLVLYTSKPEIVPNREPWPHGPFLGYEWWISADGLNWQRPYRNSSALDHMQIHFPYRLTDPVRVGDELRWAIGREVYTMNRKRMFYVNCLGNAEMLTRSLELSGEPFTLEVKFGSADRKETDALRQGYLMAEILDEKGEVIPGFEKEKCLFLPDPHTQLTLKWEDQFLPSEGNVGRVRLKIYFRDVRLYSLSY